MIQVSNHDPKVSVPIVCGRYMRATAFFFATETTTYLVTARHNVAPTRSLIRNPRTGGSLWKVVTDDFLPEIDIYLRDTDGWIRKQVDIREKPDTAVFSDPSVDVLAVRIPFDPQSFGYTVFTASDLDHSDNEQDVFLYGWGHDALPSPNKEYSVDSFTKSIKPPCEVEIENSGVMEGGILGVGLDSDPCADFRYNGLSGTPVLGEGLLGIHSGTGHLSPGVDFEKFPVEDLLRVHYYSAEVLDKALR